MNNSLQPFNSNLFFLFILQVTLNHNQISKINIYLKFHNKYNLINNLQQHTLLQPPQSSCKKNEIQIFSEVWTNHLPIFNLYSVLYTQMKTSQKVRMNKCNKKVI